MRRAAAASDDAALVELHGPDLAETDTALGVTVSPKRMPIVSSQRSCIAVEDRDGPLRGECRSQITHCSCGDR